MNTTFDAIYPILDAILATIGGTTILIGMVCTLSKMLIEKRLSQDLEKFKSDLEHANQVKITELKAKMENMFHEYKENIKNLSAERIKAVKVVHNAVIEAWAGYTKMISLMRSISEEIPISDQVLSDVNDCIKTLNQLLECTTFNEIYLPSSLSDKILEWRKNLSITCEVYGPS
ncbi:hypothetical protein MGMO_146c00050 [Methyloglobulus morosus KoM1]|uniref:Uncharacterized protein n=1 Tax=Methyloglobulus morosus KoM1 TaxID=1116472 RepID=V5DM30_9GAMM|nr:hypothetical protein [Methyloglobulus morosus]ESS68466.1 hypothetical protein MGMO_146c00050 [Methyloglobulus morosus KoM1]